MNQVQKTREAGKALTLYGSLLLASFLDGWFVFGETKPELSASAVLIFALADAGLMIWICRRLARLLDARIGVEILALAALPFANLVVIVVLGWAFRSWCRTNSVGLGLSIRAEAIEALIQLRRFAFPLIATAATLVGLAEMPYDYYMLLRVLFCAGCVYHAVVKRTPAVVNAALVVLAVLHNPVVPVHLREKTTWTVVDLGTAAFFWYLTARGESFPNR